jgi:hypothetical protein
MGEKQVSNVIKMIRPVDFHQAANVMADGHLGGFAESLALTWFKADSVNKAKIQSGWAELFLKAFEIFEARDRS